MNRLFLFLISAIGVLEIGYTQHRLDFKPLRYEEVYGKVAIDSNMTFMDRIKYIPLLKNDRLTLSLGGELRSQYQFFKNELWGDIPDDTDGFVFNRGLLHLETKYKERLRLFAQLQSGTAISRIDLSPIDQNELELHQLFVDYTFHLRSSEITLRIGRQEMLYGSQRLISVREGPNNRQSFDAIKVALKAKDFKTEIFYSQFVRSYFGSFNDRMNPDTKLFGSYNIINNLPVINNIALYYFGLHKRSASFNIISGEERRHSIGTRIWDNTNDWNYDFEAVWQFGKIADQSIAAWTVSINTNYRFPSLKLQPKIGLKTEIISGDKSPKDGRLQTFNPLFPRGAYFGLGAFLGPANLFDVHPYAELEVTDKVSLGLDYDFFWRLRTTDGIYMPNASLLYPSSDSPHSYIGSQLGAFLACDLIRSLSLEVEATFFDAGYFLEDVSAGRDIFFTATTLTYRF
ncbi:alginate export family protein [Sinomicrobium sp. M5D2P17]